MYQVPETVSNKRHAEVLIFPTVDLYQHVSSWENTQYNHNRKMMSLEMICQIFRVFPTQPLTPPLLFFHLNFPSTYLWIKTLFQSRILHYFFSVASSTIFKNYVSYMCYNNPLMLCGNTHTNTHLTPSLLFVIIFMQYVDGILLGFSSQE